LYDLQKDVAESDNVASQHPEVSRELSARVIRWWKSMPH
jgi:hypothetical protein